MNNSLQGAVYPPYGKKMAVVDFTIIPCEPNTGH